MLKYVVCKSSLSSGSAKMKDKEPDTKNRARHAHPISAKEDILSLLKQIKARKMTSLNATNESGKLCKKIDAEMKYKIV